MGYNVKNLVFDTVSITPKKSPVYRITNGQDIQICKNILSKETNTFLEVAGEISSNIRIHGSDLSKASRAVLMKDRVKQDAVSVE